uniref:Uncharacterized protein n=1 Tax=Amphora coffeiformis TaxID=265554 RepID=A0A7S3P3G7_9STRA
MNNETICSRNPEMFPHSTGGETEAPLSRVLMEGELLRPSKYAVKICGEITNGELTNLEFELCKFTLRDMRYFARCFRDNQTIQSIVLPVHLFEQDDVLDDMLHFLEHNQRVNRVAFSSSPGCSTSFDVINCLTKAISMNRSIDTLALSQHLQVRGNLDGGTLNLRESNLKVVRVVDYDTTITTAIFEALGNCIQCVELIAMPARIRGLFLGGAYGTPFQTETLEALSRLLRRSTSITKLVIKGYMGGSFEHVASALMTNQSVRELVLLSPRFLSHNEAGILLSIVQHAPLLENLTLDGRALLSDDFLLVSKAVASRQSVTRFSVSIDDLEVSPEIVSTLLPKHGHLSEVCFGSMNFSQVPSSILATMGHTNLTSLAFNRTPLHGEQLQAVLHGTKNGALKNLRSLKLHTSYAITRRTFDCLANCLKDNISLHELSFDCRDGLSVAYVVYFDEKRRCRVDARLRDVSRGQLDVLVEWLSVTSDITLTKFNVQYAKQQTLEYLSEHFLGKFDELLQFSITWPADVSPETRRMFISAIQKNQTLLYIFIGNRDVEMLHFVQFVQARNRVKALLQDSSVRAGALWPRVLHAFGRKDNRSAIFVAAKEGIGNFWLPDA